MVVDVVSEVVHKEVGPVLELHATSLAQESLQTEDKKVSFQLAQKVTLYKVEPSKFCTTLLFVWFNLKCPFCFCCCRKKCEN